MNRGRKPRDERADFGASQLERGAIDREDRRDRLYLGYDLETVLSQGLSGFDEIDDAIRETRKWR